MPHQTIGRFGLRIAAHSIETTNFDVYVCQFTQPDAPEAQPTGAAYLDLANEAVTFGGSEASFHLKEAFAGFVPKAIG